MCDTTRWTNSEAPLLVILQLNSGEEKKIPTHISVMFSISASLCKTGNELMPNSGSTQEILVLLQEQVNGHASVDIHGSPEPTVIPSSATQPSHRSDHREPIPGEEGAPLPAPQALISGAN